MTETIRILFIDDHTLFRESVVRLLEQEAGISVVADCNSMYDAMTLIANVHVDLVLLDYDLGMERGTDFVGKIRSTLPEIKILMVTGGMDASATLQAVKAGVSGIVLKHSDPDQLIEAIRRVAAGQTWWDTGLILSLGGEAHSTSTVSPGKTLTPRHSKVLRGIMDGLSNKEIASQLNTSETSVKSCIQELFNKAGVRSRAQLVRVTIEKHSSDWLK